MLTSRKKLLEKCTELGITFNKSSTKEKLIELIQQKEKTPIFEIPCRGIQEIKYVYHLADIHIRYIERHDEYKAIFDKMFEKIKQDDCYITSIMVISGDIFHNRDRFVSETLLLFDDFVKKITEFINIFVIVGNHDCFNHSDRLDSISGISSIVNYEKFHLLKKTGVYKFSNISFGVSSLLDGMGLPLADTLSPDTVKIAMFHGLVSGCVLDNGMTQEDGINISSFKGYDIVMLGDVHKRQFLNKEKTIAYPGSLIQQTFKEEMNHGYLKWDLETKQSEFIVLENDYSFIDIPVVGVDISSIKFSKFSRIRLIVSPSDNEQIIEETLQECEKYTKVISIKKSMKDLHTTVNSLEQSLQADIDTHELDIIKSMTPIEKIDDVIALHKELLCGIDYDETFNKSLPWSIDKIEFRNIFSYGGDILNVIHLKNGVTGILANNAAGKTNILNTILYGLFGNSRTQNHLNKNIVSRYNKKEDLLVRLTIVMKDNKKYFIERTAKTKTRSRINSSEAGQLDITETLKFYTDDEILNMSSKPETEKLLRDTLSILGKDEFVLTNMMSNISYGSTMSIISMTGAQFDEVFNNIFNLNKYVSLHKNSKSLAKVVSDEIKTNQTKIDMITSNLKDYTLDKIVSNISSLEISTAEKNEKITEKVSRISDIDTELLKLKASGSTKTKDTIIEEISECENLISEYTGDIETLVTKEDDISLEYGMLRKEYNKDLTCGPNPCFKIIHTTEEIERLIITEESLKKKVEFNADITNEYIKAKKYLNSINSENTLDLEDMSNVIKKLNWDSGINHYLLSKGVHTKLLSDLDKVYVDPNLLLKYKKVIEDKETRDKTITDNIKIDQNLSKLKKMLVNRKTQDAYTLKDKLSKLMDLLDYIDAYHQKHDLETELKTIINNQRVNTLLSEKNILSESLDILRDKLKAEELKLFSLRKDLERYEKLRSNLDVLTPILSELWEKLEVYKIYIEITNQKNLPKRIISNVIKNITDDANSLIYNTTGLLCEIQENEKWEVVVSKGDLILGPEHCSGYERFILNTALKISFDKYKQLSSIKLFMVDETIDCVSESNLDQIDVLLECLYKHYSKVILISHNEDLKKKINNRIEIKIDKNDGSSII